MNNECDFVFLFDNRHFAIIDFLKIGNQQMVWQMEEILAKTVAEMMKKMKDET